MSRIDKDETRSRVLTTLRPNRPLGMPQRASLGEAIEARVRQYLEANRIQKLPSLDVVLSGDFALASLFSTAAIEVWQRAVHALIVSCAISRASQQWSVVSGYYSSHYCVRAYAHLGGILLLYRLKRVAKIELTGSGYNLHMIKKNGSDREHALYWKETSTCEFFGLGRLASRNDDDESPNDARQRNIANYYDHVDAFRGVESATIEMARDRLYQLATLRLPENPLPRAEHYPDLDRIHLAAYYRIIRFRDYMDGLLESSSSYWNAHRDPQWARGLMTFQRPEELNIAGVFGDAI